MQALIRHPPETGFDPGNHDVGPVAECGGEFRLGDAAGEPGGAEVLSGGGRVGVVVAGDVARAS